MKRFLQQIVAFVIVSGAYAQSPFPCELSGGEGEPAMGGLSDIQIGQYHDNGAYFNILEAYQNVTLISARVYANESGPRTFALLSEDGEDVLVAEVFDVPDGWSTVEFNWQLDPGSYGLATLSNNPQLWRDDLNSDINYPYEIGNYGAITGTNIQGENEFNYYYFFYDVMLGPSPAFVNSGGYPCDKVELLDVESLSNLGGGNNGNDTWGWYDAASGREIAMYGRSNGTSFIDVTDPTNIKYFASLQSATGSATHRDIKVFNNHAFVVSEASGHGLQIVRLADLLSLPTNVTTEISPTSYYDNFGNAHNIMINEETGFAYVVGSNTLNGGLHILDIQNPVDPVLVGGFDEYYSHDVHPIVYQGPDEDYFGQEIVICFNGYNGLAIVNAQDKTDVELISQLTYNQSGYTHQGWVGENHTYCFFNDELDEENFGINTRTYIMDISDLDNPEIVGYYEATTTAVDHNMYIIGDKMYQSNYLSGLRVLDVSNATNGDLELVGYFDTNPESDSPQMTGAWSNYPYFPSGNIGVSTFTHFFMLRPSDAIAPNSVSIDEPAAGENAAVYPNPAQSTIQLQGFTGEHHLALFGMDGHLIKAWEALPGTAGLNLAVGHLPEGVYVLKGMETGRSARFVVAK
jgi:choice-of-anchor B domain-containing protein